MSQNGLARRVGISSGYLSQLINGRRSPSPRLRKRLQEVLEEPRFDGLFAVEPGDSSSEDGATESTGGSR